MEPRERTHPATHPWRRIIERRPQHIEVARRIDATEAAHRSYANACARIAHVLLENRNVVDRSAFGEALQRRHALGAAALLNGFAVVRREVTRGRTRQLVARKLTNRPATVEQRELEARTRALGCQTRERLQRHHTNARKSMRHELLDHIVTGGGASADGARALGRDASVTVVRREQEMGCGFVDRQRQEDALRRSARRVIARGERSREPRSQRGIAQQRVDASQEPREIRPATTQATQAIDERDAANPMGSVVHTHAAGHDRKRSGLHDAVPIVGANEEHRELEAVVQLVEQAHGLLAHESVRVHRREHDDGGMTARPLGAPEPDGSPLRRGWSFR